MTTKRLGRGLGTAVMVLAFVGISSVTAYADGTCYVACSPPTTTPVSTSGGGGTTGTGVHAGTGLKAPETKAAGGSATSSGSGAKTSSQLTAASGGSLPFTGADIEEMTIGGVGALLVGGVLLRRSRNRRRAAA